MVKRRINHRLAGWACLVVMLLLQGWWWGPKTDAAERTITGDTSTLASCPVVYTVSSTSDQVASKSFTVSAASVDEIYQANYYYSANFQSGGYVLVTDSNGYEIYKSSESGYFGGMLVLERGKSYTIKACGGVNGNVNFTLNYMERINSGFVYTISRVGMDQADDSGEYNITNLYLPTIDLSPGLYQQGRLGRNNVWNVNSKNNLVVRPYDIKVYYETNMSRNASYDIISCDSQGNQGSSIVSGGTTSGYFTIVKNQGVVVTMNTGHDKSWHDLEHWDIGGNCEIRLRFRLDEAAPNAPVLNVKNPGESGVVKLNKFYTNKPLVLQWGTPQDKATLLSDGTVIGPGGVTQYQLDIYQNKRLICSEKIQGSNTSENTYAVDLPEGEYYLKMRAFDLDQNVSPESNTINLIVDRSAPKINLTASGVKIDSNSLSAVWNPVEDKSDIKEYQVALTTTMKPPGEAQITTTESQASFTGLMQQKSFFVWVRAVDQIGNIGEWSVVGPFNLSGQPVNVTAVPKATLNSLNQPQYQIELYLNSLLAGTYLIERQTEGSSSRQTIANLTYEQLAQNGFKIVDNNGLAKHGCYFYYVTHKSGSVTNSYQTEKVTIPNLPAVFTVSGPENQTTAQSFTHTIDLTNKTDYEGDSLKFKVWYRPKDGEAKSSGVFVTGPVSITFPASGTWEWWVEVGEFHNNQLIAKHPLSTSQVIFIRSSTAYQPDGTQVAKDQPRYEDSAPGFGKAVRVEYRATIVPSNPFFTGGVDDWMLVAKSGTSTTKESVSGGIFGGKIAKIAINKPGYLANHVQFYKSIGAVSSGTKIACQIRARASVATNAAVFKCSNDIAPAEIFGSQNLNLTTEYQTFKLLAVATSATNARIGLDLGNVPAGTIIEIDYICCETGKVHPTSPHDSSRSLENLKVSTTGMNPTAGTWEQLVYVNDVTKRKGVTLYNRIFSIPQANGNSGINVYHATASSVWDLETYNDDGKGSWLANPISDSVTKENQWYRFRVTWSATEAKLQIFEVETGTPVAERIRLNPKLPTGFASYAYVGNMGLSSFPETLHDDIRISNIVRTDLPDYTKPLPVDEYTVLKLNLDGTLEPEACQPAIRTLTIQPATTTGVTLPLFFETSPGKPLQLTATVNLTGQAVEYRWNPGDGGAEFTGEQPVYTYNKLGDYTLTLKVKDSNGQVYTATSTVKVRNSTSGTVVTNETWSGTHLVSGEVTVASGTTLTIQAGTVIYMTAGSSLKIEGNLQASDSNKAIVFKSEDGSLWQGLLIGGSGTVTLNGVTVQGAKVGIACVGTGQVNLSNTVVQNCQSGLHAYSGTIKASNCTFKNNQIYGIKEDNGCNPVLTGCQFQGNGIHYYDEKLYNLTATQLNTGSNSGNTFVQ